MRRAPTTAALAMCTAVAVAGCSFSATVPPPNYAPQTHGYPVCDRRVDGRMVLDGFGAGLALVGPVIYGTLVASGEESFDSDDGLPALAISTGVAVLLFAAIRSGFHRAARCEAAHIQYEHWYEQRTGQR